MALDPISGWRRQRLRVIASDAGRKGENENCWLDWSKQPAKEGLTRLFPVIGLATGAPRHEALEIAITVDHIVSNGPPRFAVRAHSALLATDVTLTPFQPSPSGEWATIEIRKLLEKALSFGNQLRGSFVLIGRGPRILTDCERAKAPAKQDPPTPCGRVCQRVAFANVACSSQLLSETNKDGHAARADDRTHCRSHVHRDMTARDRKFAFAARPSDPEARIRKAENRVIESAAKTERFTARMTIDVTPEMRGRIKITVFQRGLIVADMPRDPRANFVKCHGAWFDE